MVQYFVSLFIIAIVSGSAHSYGGYEESYPSSYPPKKVEAAIMSKSKVKTVPMMSSKGGGGGGSTVVDINGGGGGGLVLRFNSSPGSNIQSLQKASSGGGGKVQKQSIVAEPDLLIQDVQKPVIQKVRLQISPIRKVFQEVKPVQEQVETIIAKGMDDGGDSKYPPPPPPSPPMPKYGDMY